VGHRRNPTPIEARATLRIAIREAAVRGEIIDPDAVIAALMPAADELEAAARAEIDALLVCDAERAAVHEAERAVWFAEKEALTARHKRAVGDLVAISGCSQEGPLEDPHGFYVYFLWDHNDRIVYIGRSGNIFRRLGEHVLARGVGIWRITVVQCPDEGTMCRLEGAAIAEHQPEWNIVGVSV
jgi:hypothetical protein